MIDFLETLISRTAPQHHSQLMGLFERITFFDLAVESAVCENLSDSTYRVQLTVRAGKSCR